MRARHKSSVQITSQQNLKVALTLCALVALALMLTLASTVTFQSSVPPPVAWQRLRKQSHDQRGKGLKLVETSFRPNQLSVHKGKKDKKLKSKERTLLQEIESDLDGLITASARRSRTWGQTSHVGDRPFFPPCTSPGGSAQAPCYMSRPDYVAKSKNPCWRSNEDNLSCIPYFYIVGVSKSGTTDLHHRIVQHPQVIETKKEPHILARITEGPYTLDEYSRVYNNFSLIVKNEIAENGHSDFISGDASTSTFNSRVMNRCPENLGCDEPRVTLAHSLMHSNPRARVLIIFRDPIERMYSMYLYYSYHQHRIRQGNPSRSRASPQAFHRTVEDALGKFMKCFRSHSIRHCAFTEQLDIAHGVLIGQNLYWVLLSDWVRVVPRSQLHVMHFQDYVTDMGTQLTNVFGFLGLGPLSGSEMSHVLASNEKSNTGPLYSIGRMQPRTRMLLKAFFTPFQKRFNSLLHELNFPTLPS